MAMPAELGRWRHHCHPHLHHWLSVCYQRPVHQRCMHHRYMRGSRDHESQRHEERSQAGPKSQSLNWVDYILKMSIYLYLYFAIWCQNIKIANISYSFIHKENTQHVEITSSSFYKYLDQNINTLNFLNNITLSDFCWCQPFRSFEESFRESGL